MATTERGFGRMYSPDERDKNFPMRLLLDPLREQFFPRGIPEGYRHYTPGPLRDQGLTGTCVAFSTTCRLESAPIMQPLPNKMTPFDLYRRIVPLDPWSGNDREAAAPDHALQFGTDVRTSMKVCQSLGIIKNYLWAESAEDVRAWHLAGFGGIIFGITWKTDMMDTDSEGFIRFTGRDEGGHAITTIGYNDRVKHNGKYVRAGRLQQTWGKWGHKGTGRAWISYDDIEKAIADRGEAAAMTEVRVTPTNG